MFSKYLYMVYLMILAVIQYVTTQTIDIAPPRPPIVYQLNTWNTTITIYMPSAQAASYNSEIQVEIDTASICFTAFTASACSFPFIAPVWGCQCIRNTGENYTVLVRRVAHIGDSGKTIKGSISAAIGKFSVTKTGSSRLPFIYSARIDNIFEGVPMKASSGQTVSVTAETDVTLSLVLGTPPPPYRLSVQLDTVPVPGSPATDNSVTFTAPASSQTVRHLVNVNVEIGGSTDEFQFTLKVLEPTGTSTIAISSNANNTTAAMDSDTDKGKNKDATSETKTGAGNGESTTANTTESSATGIPSTLGSLILLNCAAALVLAA